MANAYQKAGVDVHAGYEVVERIKKHIKRTERLGVMGGIGAFGGMFDLSTLNVKEPVLISGTDGVGTKLIVANMADKHDTIGIDVVAMCVNDIIAQGAEPLFFLDYIATGKNVPERLEQVVAGVAQGCVQAGAGLVGGETAEMPGIYANDDYDLAGFTVGVVEKSELITGEKIKAGDVLIGIASSGVHSNGFSLIRKVFFEQNNFSIDEKLPEFEGKELSKVLLEPTRIYVKQTLPLVKEKLINGASHVTGGGFVENIPRIFGEDLAAKINLGTWEIPVVFAALEKYGKIPTMEMYEIFNMGIGFVYAVSKENVARVKELLAEQGEKAYEIGEIIERKDNEIEFVGA